MKIGQKEKKKRIEFNVSKMFLFLLQPIMVEAKTGRKVMKTASEKTPQESIFSSKAYFKQANSSW